MKYTIIASGVSLQTAIEFVRKSTNDKKFGIKRTDWDINNVYLYTDVNEKSGVGLPIHYFDSNWQIVELYEEKSNTKEKYDNKNNDNKKCYDCGGSSECKKRCLHECHHDNNKDNCGCKSHSVASNISLDDIKKASDLWNSLFDNFTFLFR